MTCFAEIWRPGPKSPWWVFVAFSCKPKAGRRRHIPQQVGRVVTEEVGHCIPSGAASPIPAHLCARFPFLQQENRGMQLKPRHTRSCVQIQLQLLEWTYIAFVSNLKTTHLELARPQHKKLKSIPAFWRYYSLYYLYWGKKSGSPREAKKDQGTPCPWVPSWWASASPRSRIPRPLGWPSIRSCPGWLAHEEVCDLQHFMAFCNVCPFHYEGQCQWFWAAAIVPSDTAIVDCAVSTIVCQNLLSCDDPNACPNQFLPRAGHGRPWSTFV